MVISTKASQQRQNIVEIQKNWIVSSLHQKRDNTRIFATLPNTHYNSTMDF